MEKAKYETDKMSALYYLEKMHNHLIEQKPFPEDLIKNGKAVMGNLSNWKFKNVEDKRYNNMLIELLFDHIALDSRIKTKSREAYQEEINNLLSAGVFTC
jgi:HSP90 family molecular chaperone